MSDIKRYGVWDKPPREDLVTYADHEAAIALRTRVCAEAFEDELARTEERVLADAKARIGRLAAPNGSYGEAEWGFLRGVTAALAALTQPQTERCPEDCDGFGQLIGDSDGPCPACSGLEPDRGGAAAEKCPNPDCEGGTRPNGEGGWDMCPDCLEAVNADGGRRGCTTWRCEMYNIQCQGLPLTNSTLVEEVVAAVYEACLDRAMGEEDASEVAAVLRGQLTGTRPTPTPYAKAFRERVCPVPEFPGIEKEES